MRADVAELLELCVSGDLGEARHNVSLVQADLDAHDIPNVPWSPA
ncbi:hypothetical protein [Streptomyces sp. NPDC048496]